MVQIVGNQANLWLREETTLAMPGETAETGYAQAADRSFIFVRSGTTWALAGQRMIPEGTLTPLTEPLSESTPIIPDWTPVDPPTPPAGTEAEFYNGTTEPTTDEPITEEAAEADAVGTDPAASEGKVDGTTASTTTASFPSVEKASTEFTSAVYSPPAARPDGMVLAGTIPSGLCYSCMVSYARKYAKKYNTSYRNFKKKGGDCTNFVSQALYAGGWKRDLGWYRSNSNWWYNSGNQTFTWTGAENWSQFAPKRTKHIDNVWKLQIADVLQADWDANGTMDHTMIVTKRSGNEIYLTYHSSDELDKPLSRIIREVRSAGHTKVKWYAYRT